MKRVIVPTLLAAAVAVIGWQAASWVASTELRATTEMPSFTPITVVATPQGKTSPAAGAPSEQAAPLAFDSSKAWEHLRQMVAIGPRPAGSPALRQTRAYITRQVTALGLTVQEQTFVGQTPIGPIEMVNLIVRLPGKRTDKILFTGHYDTKLMPAKENFVGASDGASSAAFLIEWLRILKDRPRELTYEFVWFDGEEAVKEWTGDDNTYGSRYYVQAAQKAGALSSIKAMVLVDMIGDRNLTIKRESASTAWLTDIIWAAAKRLGHSNVFLDESMPIEDDHVPFLKAGVPAVDIIDLDYPAWHHQQTCCDDIKAVAARSLQIVGDVLLAALPEIEKRALK